MNEEDRQRAREVSAKMLDYAAEGLLAFSVPYRPKWLVMQNIKSQPFFRGKDDAVEPEYVKFRRPVAYARVNSDG